MSATKEWLMHQEERSQPGEDWDERLATVDISLDELARRIEVLERRMHELGERFGGAE
jgi:hypothetical protein